ncbi:MAG: hypothetical protein KDK27_08530 [Leptospiraceae bacterium]|nr:hypothetical protein [Leptospiraceae bacterium]
MINPLEIRVALNAASEMGILANQATAGSQYRQVQELGKALQETMARPEQVVQVNTNSGATFYAVENPGPDSPRRQEMWERLRNRHTEMMEAWRLYGPESSSDRFSMNRPYSGEGAGTIFDLVI